MKKKYHLYFEKQKQKRQTTISLALAFWFLVLQNLSESSDAANTQAQSNPLCNKINNGKLNEIKFESATYLQNKDQTHVYLMESNQLYQLSVSHYSKDGNNPLTPKGEKFWELEPIVHRVMKGNPKLANDPGKPITLFTVVEVDFEVTWQFWRYPDPVFYAVVRTNGSVHTADVKKDSETEFSIRGNPTKIPNIYPHFSLIVKTDTAKIYPFSFFRERPKRGYVIQSDKWFHGTGSPVMYKFDFNKAALEPFVAVSQSDTERGGYDIFYLTSTEADPSKVTFLSVQSDKAGVVAAATESPLLRGVAIGFVTPGEQLVLIEPVIGCVYTVDGFDGLVHGRVLPLKRVPIEEFFKCSDSPKKNLNFSSDRCDSYSKSSSFYQNHTTSEVKPDRVSPPSVDPNNAPNGNGSQHGSQQHPSEQLPLEEMINQSNSSGDKRDLVIAIVLLGGILLLLCVLVGVCFLTGRAVHRRRMRKVNVVLKQHHHHGKKMVTKTVKTVIVPGGSSGSSGTANINITESSGTPTNNNNQTPGVTSKATPPVSGGSPGGGRSTAKNKNKTKTPHHTTHQHHSKVSSPRSRHTAGTPATSGAAAVTFPTTIPTGAAFPSSAAPIGSGAGSGAAPGSSGTPQQQFGSSTSPKSPKKTGGKTSTHKK